MQRTLEDVARLRVLLDAAQPVDDAQVANELYEPPKVVPERGEPTTNTIRFSRRVMGRKPPRWARSAARPAVSPTADAAHPTPRTARKACAMWMTWTTPSPACIAE